MPAAFLAAGLKDRIRILPFRCEGALPHGLGFGTHKNIFSEAFKLQAIAAIEQDHTVTPSPSNPLGVKGVGEAGTIGSAPTVMNAVVDGLSHLGVTAMDMPASPHRVWSAIQSTGQSADAEKPTAQPEGSAR